MMERINLENYEAFFLDFVEGNLSERQIVMLNTFLESHLHLKQELEEFEAINLSESEAEKINWKPELLREETTGLTRLDYLLISEMEGQMSSEEKKELATLVKANPKIMEELEVYHKTKLPIIQHEVYADKSSLIRKESKVIVWWQYASAVAAAILVLVLFNWNTEGREYEPKAFAFDTQSTEKSETTADYAFIVEVDEFFKKEIITRKSILKKQEVDPDLNYAENKKEAVSANEKKEVAPIEEDPIEFALKEKEEEPIKENKSVVEVDAGNELAHRETKVRSKKTKDFVPINEYAKEKIKSNILKGKTFSETVMEEIAEISNDKIILETTKDEKGETEKFALNIGKFSFSRNK